MGNSERSPIPNRLGMAFYMNHGKAASEISECFVALKLTVAHRGGVGVPRFANLVAGYDSSPSSSRMHPGLSALNGAETHSGTSKSSPDGLYLGAVRGRARRVKTPHPTLSAEKRHFQ